MLEDLGCEVVTAAGGRHAIYTLLADARIEVLIIDVNMPDMDGFAVAQADTQMEELKVIILSGPKRDRRLRYAQRLPSMFGAREGVDAGGLMGVTKEIRRRDDDQCLGAGSAHTGERCDIVRRLIGIEHVGLEPKLSGHTLSLLGAFCMARRAAGQDRDTARRRHKLVQQRRTLPVQLSCIIATPVALPPGRARLTASPFGDWVLADERHYDRHGRGCFLDRQDSHGRDGDDDIGLGGDRLAR
jgi:CheY-like chemotaxis protein